MTFMNDLSWVLPLRNDLLTGFFSNVTLLGYDIFLFIFISFGFYFFRSRIFYQAGLLLFLTGAVNLFLKDFYQDPRPDAIYAIDLKTGDSFGWPSGHAQMAIVLWGWLALHVERTWMKISLWTVALLICISRIYLGVHDIGDVLGGVTLGVVTLYFWARVSLSDTPIKAFDNATMPVIVLVMLAVHLLFMVIYPSDGLDFVAAWMWGLMLGWFIGHEIDGRQGVELDGHIVKRVLICSLAAAAVFGGLMVSGSVLGRADGSLVGDIIAPYFSGLCYGLFMTLLIPVLIKRSRLGLPVSQNS